MELLVLISILVLLFFLWDLIHFIRLKERILLKFSILLDLFVVVFIPLVFIGIDEPKNDCCNGSAAISPDHRITFYCIVFLCITSYFISFFRKKFTTPIIELLLTAFLIIGVILNIFIMIQTGYGVFFNTPIIILFILQLVKTEYIKLEYLREFSFENKWEQYAWKILDSNFLAKYSIIILFCLPLLLFISTLLILFGQKSDSLIRAFTDTYKHTFSQLDHECLNVHCGGHYLCSVAAMGHKNVVNPQRIGYRNEKLIICNRQLLIANAFEDLIQEKFPNIHKIIRKNYNHVGSFIHKYYYVFEIKWISDVIYFAMKPFEWLFLITLYLFDRKPENRIEMQYWAKNDKDNYIENTRI